jgi:uracil DNA glycosylase
MSYPDFFKLPEDWTDFFFREEIETILIKILSTLENEKFYPENENIFRCFYLTPFDRVKIVLLGNSPYTNGSATGLCFDVKQGYLFSQDLQKIYKDLESEGFYPTKDGCLESWAKQGILMLNSSLTTQPSLWEELIEQIFKKLSEKKELIWVILPGDEHIKLIPSHHTVFEMESGVFKKVNNVLYKKGLDKISW